MANLIKSQECDRNSLIYECIDQVCIESLNIDSTMIEDYSADNIIYRDSVEYIFSYTYEKKGKKYLILNEQELLAEVSESNENKIDKVSFMCSEAESANMRRVFPDYKQSGLLYYYYNEKNISLEPFYSSGLVENCKNIWIHPFRKPVYFAILNLNPYPFVKFPIRVNQEYNWQLNVAGEPYMNAIWKTWEGSTLRIMNYKVVKECFRFFPYSGNIKVFQIKATAESEIGVSSAEFWFSKVYGFVEIKYNNIDGSVFHFTLSEIIDHNRSN